MRYLILLAALPLFAQMPLPTGSSGGSGGGATTFAALTDKASADIPSTNTPTSSALALKAPLASPTFTGTVDASGAAHTLSAKVGTTAAIPATCTVGEQYFASDATAGANKYYCSATNTWTQGAINASNLTTGTLANARLASGAAVSNLGFTPLNPANNLSEVTAAMARTNLGLVAVASSGSATDLSSGTLAAARMLNAGVHTGDVSGTFPATVVAAINGTNLAGLGAGLLKQNGSGVPALAVAGTDYLNVIAESINSQTGTTYTAVNSDCGKLITFSNTGATTLTLPQAGASGNFAARCVIDVLNLNTGVVTISPVTSTINGTVSVLLNKFAGARVVSDGANYVASAVTLTNGAVIGNISVGISPASPSQLYGAQGGGGRLDLGNGAGAGITAIPAAGKPFIITGATALTPTATSFSATPAFALANTSVVTITLTGNVTSSTMTGLTTGQMVVFHICQDATGSRTFAWPALVHGAMTIGSTLSTCSDQPFVAVGTTDLYALSAGVINQ